MLRLALTGLLAGICLLAPACSGTQPAAVEPSGDAGSTSMTSAPSALGETTATIGCSGIGWSLLEGFVVRVLYDSGPVRLETLIVPPGGSVPQGITAAPDAGVLTSNGPVVTRIEDGHLGVIEPDGSVIGEMAIDDRRVLGLAPRHGDGYLLLVSLPWSEDTNTTDVELWTVDLDGVVTTVAAVEIDSEVLPHRVSGDGHRILLNYAPAGEAFPFSALLVSDTGEIVEIERVGVAPILLTPTGLIGLDQNQRLQWLDPGPDAPTLPDTPIRGILSARGDRELLVTGVDGSLAILDTTTGAIDQVGVETAGCTFTTPSYTLLFQPDQS